MTTRSAPLRVPSVAGALRSGDAVDFGRKVGRDAVDVDVTFSAAIAALALHGLGKRYVGGIVIGVSASHPSNIAVATPEACTANGYDPALYVLVTSNTAYTGLVRVRMVV